METSNDNGQIAAAAQLLEHAVRYNFTLSQLLPLYVVQMQIFSPKIETEASFKHPTCVGASLECVRSRAALL